MSVQFFLFIPSVMSQHIMPAIHGFRVSENSPVLAHAINSLLCLAQLCQRLSARRGMYLKAFSCLVVQLAESVVAYWRGIAAK